jgi:hypothetical protein
MRSKLFVITSVIEPTAAPLTYSNSRSFFTTEERLRQTFSTVNSIQNAFPDANIVLLDGSNTNFSGYFGYIKNFKYVSLKEIDSDVCEIVNNHKHKSYCECLMLKTFYEKFKDYILEHDYTFKVSGRYLVFDMNNHLFTEENKNKIFFKNKLIHEWQDYWGYNYVDRREQQQNNKLYQYSTVLYGFGTQQLDTFIELHNKTIDFLSDSNNHHFDMETLFYFYMRDHEDNIIETNWRVSGWLGPCGTFVFY